tara:strand:- start:210 stop:500 length:291 start_codon:yes stop_codon:yes gene_type:complete
MTNVTIPNLRNLVIETAIMVFNNIYPKGVRMNTRGIYPKHYSTGFSGTHGDSVYILIIHNNQITQAMEDLEMQNLPFSVSLQQHVKNHTALCIFIN